MTISASTMQAYMHSIPSDHSKLVKFIWTSKEIENFKFQKTLRVFDDDEGVSVGRRLSARRRSGSSSNNNPTPPPTPSPERILIKNPGLFI